MNLTSQMCAMKKTLFGFALVLASLAACTTPPVAPPAMSQPKPSLPLEGLGRVELSFSDLQNNFSAKLENVGSSQLGTQNFTTVSGLSYTALSQSTFLLKNVRYLSATFKVTSTTNISNLTFVAEVLTGKTILDTAISRLKKFDGTDANTSFARDIKPTHGLTLSGSGQDALGLNRNATDFQAFAEADLTGYAPADGGYLLPYGFVAKTSTGTRLITAANPGFVTFAFQMPSSGTADPYSLSVFLQAATDPTTRVTESQLEYQKSISTAEARALAISASQVYKLPKSQLVLQAPNPNPTVLCQVRTAGTAAAPLAQLFNLLPPVLSSTNPLTPAANAQNVARVTPNASIDLDTSITNNSGVPVMHSSFQRYDDVNVQSTSSGFSITPARDYKAGEQLEVSIPASDGERDCGAAGYVYRYQTSSGTADAFRAKTDYAVGTNPYLVAIGDLNGDGKLDLAITNLTDNSVSVLLQQSAGGYSRTDYAVGTKPYSVAMGDLNGDGKLDLAITNFTDSSVSVLLQSAGGYSRTDYAVGTNPIPVAIGDLNGDGKLDLAIANNGAASVSVLLQQNDGSYSRTDYTVGMNPRSVAIGDLNGDGKLDLAAVNRADSSVSVLLQQAAGGYSRTDYTVGASPYSVAIDDLNGDRKLDLAIANYNNGAALVSVLLQQSSGGYSRTDYTVGSTPSSVAMGDLNGDGKLDLATASYFESSVSVLLQQSTGGYSRTDYGVGTNPYSVAMGDLNGDGKLDLATANSGSSSVQGSVSVLLNATAQLNLGQTHQLCLA